MARITTSSHPLVTVRVICGFTRADLARIAGVSVAQVQNIELGRSPMPKEAALRVEAVTGCDAASLQVKDKVPLFITGAMFTKKLWDEWRNTSPTEEQVKWAEDALVFRLRMMIRASGHGLFVFSHAVSRALGEAAKNASITPQAMDAECRKESDPKSHSWQVSQLRTSLREAGHTAAEIDKHLGRFSLLDKCDVVTERYRVCPDVAEDDEARDAMVKDKAEGQMLLLANSKVKIIHRAKLPDGNRLYLESFLLVAAALGSGVGASITHITKKQKS